MQNLMSTVLSVLEEHGFTFCEEKQDVPFELDSIQFISILISLEEATGISIPDERIPSQEVFTVRSLMDILTSSLEEAVSAPAS